MSPTPPPSPPPPPLSHTITIEKYLHIKYFSSQTLKIFFIHKIILQKSMTLKIIFQKHS
jgi:hypothetical protein